MEKINLTIDGKPVYALQGATVLDVAKENNIKIPTLCDHPHLKPVGACRVCIVEEETSGRILASCVTPAASDMKILTDTPSIKEYRSDIIRLMIANHPESCILCSQGNRCELRSVAACLGIGDVDLYPMPHYTGLEAGNPFIIRDLSKCILCGKCIRADHEMVVVGAIDYNLRGLKSRPSAVHEMPLEESNCTFCGTCVSLCPTGALMTKSSGYSGSPQKEGITICSFCGVGCRIKMGSVNERVVEVNPAHETDSVNKSTLCVRGHFAHDYLVHPARLRNPLIKRENGFEKVSWENALSFVAEKLIDIKKEHGSQSMGFIGSSKCSNEENYLFQKMARQIFGTHNIDNSGYLSTAPITSSLVKRLGKGERIKPLKELEEAELIFIIGTDPAQSVPVAGYFIRRASRFGKIPVILTGSRRTELVPFSSIWLQHNPGSDLHLISSLLSTIISNKFYNREFISKYTADFEAFAESLIDLNINDSSSITGIDIDDINNAVSLMKNKKIAFVVGEDLCAGPGDNRTIDALINLALMTGSLGAKGSGLYIIASESNQTGAVDMGTVPDMLPGRAIIADNENRKYWESKYETGMSPDAGLGMTRMIIESEKGNLKALYIMGENPIRSLPQSQQVIKGLQNLELLVVQDILSSEITEMADVVLPGAAFSEKSGSFTNLEGRIQCFDPLVEPPGEAMPDWEIIDRIIEKTGEAKRSETINRIRNEINFNIPMYADLTGDKSQTWIRNTETKKLFSDKQSGELISFTRMKELSHEDKTSSKYPFKALLSSVRYHLGSGTRTSFSSRIKNFFNDGIVEISPADSKRMALQETDIVTISSSYGSIIREVRINEGLKECTVFIPMAFNNNDVMNLMDLDFNESEAPLCRNVCEVRLDKYSPQGDV